MIKSALERLALGVAEPLVKTVGRDRQSLANFIHTKASIGGVLDRFGFEVIGVLLACSRLLSCSC